MGTVGDSELHVVVACADRKRVAAGDPVRLGSIRKGPAAERCAMWWRALSAVPAKTPARDLYAGDHWAVGRHLPEVAEANGFAARLWVASAGYGLVSESALLAPYSATFSPDSPDAVAGRADVASDATQAWWDQLARRQLRGRDDPRSLAELAEQASPGAAIMVVASLAYVRALEVDLERALEVGRRIRFVLVTSSPGPNSSRLAAAWVPTAGRLRMSLGGALTSLHTRLARRLLERLEPTSFDAERARRFTERLVARTPEAPRIARSKAVDADVVAFIRSALRRDGSLSHSRLLRMYRESGQACEQGRFRDLFRSETAVR